MPDQCLLDIPNLPCTQHHLEAFSNFTLVAKDYLKPICTGIYDSTHSEWLIRELLVRQYFFFWMNVTASGWYWILMDDIVSCWKESCESGCSLICECWNLSATHPWATECVPFVCDVSSVVQVLLIPKQDLFIRGNTSIEQHVWNQYSAVPRIDCNTTFAQSNLVQFRCSVFSFLSMLVSCCFPCNISLTSNVVSLFVKSCFHKLSKLLCSPEICVFSGWSELTSPRPLSPVQG